MKYEVIFSKDFVKFLRKRSQISQVVIDKFELLSSDLHHPSLDIKPIVGKENHFRLRVSKYRFLYEIIEDEILIYAYKADLRGGVYK